MKKLRIKKKVVADRLAPLKSSVTMTWRTPVEVYEAIDAVFHFNFDLAASKANRKTNAFFSVKDDALTQDWSGKRAWLNPPYGRGLHKWTGKALATKLGKGDCVVMLVPARMDPKWWWQVKDHCVTVLIKGRLKFTEPGKPEAVGAPFPSMVLVFQRKHPSGHVNGDIITWDRDEEFPMVS